MIGLNGPDFERVRMYVHCRHVNVCARTNSQTLLIPKWQLFTSDRRAGTIGSWRSNWSNLEFVKLHSSSLDLRGLPRYLHTLYPASSTAALSMLGASAGSESNSSRGTDTQNNEASFTPTFNYI